MKQTLLEMVQSILAAMDSEEVNGISDTVEANQVALMVKDTYFYLVSKLDLPEHKGVFQLDPSGDADKPTLMTLPSDALKAYTVRYDQRTVDDDFSMFNDIQFLEFYEFVRQTQNLDDTLDEVDTMTIADQNGNFTFKYYNDRAPTKWTTKDDYTIFFDGYDLEVDTWLQQSKSFCYGLLKPTFTLSDSFVPDLDATMFPLLLNESTKACFVRLKQTQDPISVERARAGLISSQKTKENLPANVSAYSRFQNFGRWR